MNKTVVIESEISYLFTDGSVNPQAKIGFGAYLHVDEINGEPLKDKEKVKKFTDTSSTKLEIETLIWALKDIDIFSRELIVFTDCQNILSLSSRREKFEENDYFTSKNKKIKNHELYKEFYKLTDFLKCKFIKVKGHKPKSDKNSTDKFFELVDKGSRNALRKYME